MTIQFLHETRDRRAGPMERINRRYRIKQFIQYKSELEDAVLALGLLQGPPRLREFENR